MSTHLHKRDWLAPRGADHVELTAVDDRVSLVIDSYVSTFEPGKAVLEDLNFRLAIIEKYRDALAAHVERLEQARREYLGVDEEQAQRTDEALKRFRDEGSY